MNIDTNYPNKTIQIKGIVATDSSVVKNTICDAKVVSAPYSFAIIAALAAVGIAVITTGIASKKGSLTFNLRIRYTSIGKNINLKKEVKYNFLFEKHSKADELASKLPITSIEIGVVTLPNSSIGLFKNSGNLMLKTKRINPIKIDKIIGLTSDFSENEYSSFPLHKR